MLDKREANKIVWNLTPSTLESALKIKNSEDNGTIYGICDIRFNHAHRLWRVWHPLGHRQRNSKRSVPSGDRHNRGYPFRNRFLRLHSLVIHLILTNMVKRSYKTTAQQCRYYEMDNILEYMVETYFNDNICICYEKLCRTHHPVIPWHDKKRRCCKGYIPKHRYTMKIETDFGKYEHYSSRSILLVNLKPSDIFFESPAHVTLFGNGTLHMFLRGGQQSRLLSFMSIMADKKSSKETFVPIYDIFIFL